MFSVLGNTIVVSNATQYAKVKKRETLLIKKLYYSRSSRMNKFIPVYKELDPLQKENYRPVSLLPHVSKIFERIIHKQIMNYMTDKLAHSVTGFRKSYGTENSLVVMLEKWKRARDKGECIAGLFMDLSKAFDTINHDLLIAKLKAYGFSKEALKFMKSYLKNRKQKEQINNKFSSERDVIAGVHTTGLYRWPSSFQFVYKWSVIFYRTMRLRLLCR